MTDWRKIAENRHSFWQYEKDIAERRKELLRRIDANTALCPICGSVTAEIIKGKHAEDCELEKELADG